MRDYLDTTGCRMEFLRRQLDDDAADAVRALRQLHRRGTARRRSPRRPWSARARERLQPAGGGGRAAQDVADRAEGRASRAASARAGQAEPGRALGRLTDIGWGNRLRGCSPTEPPTARCPTTSSTPW